MTQWGANSSDNRAQGVLEMFTTSQDPANNRSLIRHAGGMFNTGVGSASGSDGYYTLYWNGNADASNSGVSYNFRNGGAPGWLEIHDHWVSHDSNGTGPVVSGRWTWGVSYSPYYTNGVDTGTQYWQPAAFAGPYAPYQAPSWTRTSDGSNVGFTSAPSQNWGSMGSLVGYQYMYSTNGGASWSAATWLDANRYSGFSLATTQPIHVVTRAISNVSYNWGYSGWSTAAYIPGVPTAPTSVSLARSGRNVTVTAGASASDSGSAITAYYVQYTIDGGASWSAAQALSSLSYTFTGLAAAKTYQFRVWATNGIGYSAYSASQPTIFVPAGGKRYDTTSSSFVLMDNIKRYDGTSWVDPTIVKRFDGTSWVDLS